LAIFANKSIRDVIAPPTQHKQILKL